MNTSKIYYDLEGNEKTILQMVKDEPLWAANRVQEGEGFEAENTRLKAEIESLDIVLAVAINENKSVWDENARLKAKLANIEEGLNRLEKKCNDEYLNVGSVYWDGFGYGFGFIDEDSQHLTWDESLSDLIDNLLTKGVD